MSFLNAISSSAVLNMSTADLGGKDKSKEIGAAKDFEALLLGQMLHSIREEGEGWLGAGDDDSSDIAFGLGEDQLAKTLAQSGGFGIARLIAGGLAAKSADAEAAAHGEAGNQARSANRSGSS